MQPWKPLGRSRVWMPQRKSSWRLRQGSPDDLFTAKSADFAKGSATQHSPKQLAQSPRSADSRVSGTVERFLRMSGTSVHRIAPPGGVLSIMQPSAKSVAKINNGP